MVTRRFLRKSILKDVVIPAGATITFDNASPALKFEKLLIDTNGMTQCLVWLIQNNPVVAASGVTCVIKHCLKGPKPPETIFTDPTAYLPDPPISAPVATEDSASEFPLFPFPMDEAEVERPRLVALELTNTEADDATVQVILEYMP